MAAVLGNCEGNAARTNREQSETQAEFRGSFESPMPGAIPVYYDNEFLYWLHPKTHKPILPEPGPELTEEEQLARSHKFADEDDTLAKCYFIGGDEGAIKIGFSIDVRSRLRAIQLCCPIKLRVLATAQGGAMRESAYHQQFWQFRLHGEWFERVPEIETEIARLNEMAKAA